jgi:hypothetical protein
LLTIALHPRSADAASNISDRRKSRLQKARPANDYPKKLIDLSRLRLASAGNRMRVAVEFAINSRFGGSYFCLGRTAYRLATHQPATKRHVIV